ncbi:drug/metabolite transporter (DMT)-like permease [Bosea sp. OAE752]|jgi:drug/metabolite transporter (DMT)-like permease|uniref:EamA family transporter n=1 Tax=Bosea spartocytisi TaxID=2773451 RepID=A0A927E8Z0_9HYPH|nr:MULTISPECIES: EamA family transporter [Bosea]MBD3844444.1 EamA family transporter [Bosea spartocytisi]MCT4470450.1 EamA family transporter [Bosea spartocytisi]
MTPWIIFWFVLSVACDVAGQLCFKIGADRLPQGADFRTTAVAALRCGWVTAGLATYVAEFFIWLRILAEVPLSIAFPIASANFLAIALASAVLLGERVGRRQWLGAFLITCGVIVVAQTA